MKIRVHVQGIKGSGLVKPGEEPSVLFGGALEVDGHLIEEVTDIRVRANPGGIFEVSPVLMPGSFEVVSHTAESWPELVRRMEEAR